MRLTPLAISMSIGLGVFGCRSHPCDVEVDSLGAPWASLAGSAPLTKDDGVCAAGEKLELLFTKTELEALDGELVTWLEGQSYYQVTVHRDRQGQLTSRRFGRESSALDLKYEQDREHEGVRVTLSQRELHMPARSLAETRAREQHAIAVAAAAANTLAAAQESEDHACEPGLFAALTSAQRPEAVIDVAELARIGAGQEPQLEDRKKHYGTLAVCDDLPLPASGLSHAFEPSGLTTCTAELNDRAYLALFRLDGKLDAQAGIFDQGGTFAPGAVLGRVFIYDPKQDVIVCHAAVNATNSGTVTVTETIDTRTDRSLGDDSKYALSNDLYAGTLEAQRRAINALAPEIGKSIRWPK